MKSSKAITPPPDALVEGIAAVFADLEHSDRHIAPETAKEAAAALDEDITFTLLGELNRLWQSPSQP